MRATASTGIRNDDCLVDTIDERWAFNLSAALSACDAMTSQQSARRASPAQLRVHGDDRGQERARHQRRETGCRCRRLQVAHV